MAKILRIDSQILTSFSHCPLRCSFNFIERLQVKEEGKQFAKGKVVHVAMESYYNDLKEQVNFKDRVDKAIATGNTFGVTETNLPQDEIERCLNALKEYYVYRRDDKIIVKAVEVPFSTLMYSGKDMRGEDIEIWYEGKMDLVAELNDQDKVVDHKTTERNFDPTDMNNQFLGYSWATGLPVMINRIGFQTSLAPSEKFKRFPFKFTPETLSNWKTYAIGKSLEYAFYLEEGKFMPNFSACEGRFGYPCSYINICRFPALAEETIKYEFVRGDIWDVFKDRNS